MEIMRMNSKAVRAGQGERKRRRTNANAPTKQQRTAAPKSVPPNRRRHEQTAQWAAATFYLSSSWPCKRRVEAG